MKIFLTLILKIIEFMEVLLVRLQNHHHRNNLS